MAYERVEVNPFAADVPAAYLALHPFGRVPALVHDGFVLYETGAIARYVDRAFRRPRPPARGSQRLARMDQIIGVVDAYAYWPLVRRVFVQDVVRPHRARQVTPQNWRRGSRPPPKVLDALEALAATETLRDRPQRSPSPTFISAR